MSEIGLDFEPFDTVFNTQCPHCRGVVQASRSAVNFEMAREINRLRKLVERGAKMHLGHTIRQEEAFYLACRKEMEKWK